MRLERMQSSQPDLMFVILVISMCLNKGRDNQTVKSNTHTSEVVGIGRTAHCFF